jgi:hypothetical protein
MAWGSDRVAPTKERLLLNTTVFMSSPWRWRESKKEGKERDGQKREDDFLSYLSLSDNGTF